MVSSDRIMITMSVDLTIELGTKEIALQLQSPPNLESQPHRPPSSSKNSRGFFSRFAGTPASLRLIRERAFFLESRNFWRSSGDSHRRFIARLIFCRVSALTTFVRLYSASLLLLASVLAHRLLVRLHLPRTPVHVRRLVVRLDTSGASPR